MQISGYSQAEFKMSQNVQTSLGTKVQDLLTTFRRGQNEYLRSTHSQSKQISAQRASVNFFFNNLIMSVFIRQSEMGAGVNTARAKSIFQPVQDEESNANDFDIVRPGFGFTIEDEFVRLDSKV